MQCSALRIWIALGIGVPGMAAGMAEDEPKVPGASGPSSVARMVSERTERKFQRARFLKPRKLDPAQMEHEFAPLIVEEISDSKAGPKSGFLDLVSKRAIFESNAVYARSAQLRANDRMLDQVLFLWAYQDLQVNPEKETTVRAMSRGVRVVLGPDGMPVLWGVSGGADKPRVFFVAKSLEEAARKEFGLPLPGRTYAVERSGTEGLDVVVAGLVEDGPVPMGPYVYLDGSSDRNVTAVRCRCSPSQFEEAVETAEYDLLPMENIDGRLLYDRTGLDLEKVIECPPLETLFRWPKLEP